MNSFVSIALTNGHSYLDYADGHRGILHLFKMKKSVFEKRAEKTLAKVGLTIHPSSLINTAAKEFNKIVHTMSDDQRKVAAEIRKKGKNVIHALTSRERKRLDLQTLEV